MRSLLIIIAYMDLLIHVNNSEQRCWNGFTLKTDEWIRRERQGIDNKMEEIFSTGSQFSKCNKMNFHMHPMPKTVSKSHERWIHRKPYPGSSYYSLWKSKINRNFHEHRKREHILSRTAMRIIEGNILRRNNSNQRGKALYSN